MAKLNIFISYAHKDEIYKNEFVEHLTPLIQSEMLEELNSNSILPGANWRDEIRKQIDKADLFILLLSSSFFASGYNNDIELQRALNLSKKGKKKIIPILLRPVDYSSLELSSYQALPRNSKPVVQWDNRDEAWIAIIKDLKAFLSSIPQTEFNIHQDISPSQKDKNINEIQALIGMGRIKQSIELIEKELADDSLSKNTLIILKSRLSSLERNNRMGIISSQNHSIELNRIVSALLDLINE